MVSLIPSGFPGFLLGSGSVVPLLHPSGSLQRMAARAVEHQKPRKQGT